jgi:hypothetical protein
MDDGQTTGWLEIDLGRDYTFDVILVSEHIALGQRVKAFSIEVYTKGVWRMWMRSTTIAQRRILRWYPVTANKVRINITESLAVPCIEKVSIYKAFGHFALESRPPPGLWIASYGEFQKTKGNWVEDDDCYLGTGESGTLLTQLYIRKFVKFWVMGNKDPNYGTMEVWVGGKHIADVDTSSSKHEREQMLYASEVHNLSGEKIELKFNGKPIAIHSMYFRVICECRITGCEPCETYGMYELESRSFSVKRGEDLKVKVRRVGGSSCHSHVYVTTVPDTAVPGVDYEHLSTDLSFDNGEVEKEVTIKVHSSGSGSQFSVEIMGATKGTIVGDNWTASVKIAGNDSFEESGHEVRRSRFVLGAVLLCGAAGLLIIALIIMKRKKSDNRLMKENDLITYTEDQSLGQND